MNLNFGVVCLMVLFCSLSPAQNNDIQVLKGQVTTSQNPLEGINITNTRTNVMTVSNPYGAFVMEVKVGDVLLFTAVNFEVLRKYVSQKEFIVGKIQVELTPKNVQLKEVIINKNPSITAENLGIIPKDQVKLTPAERRLQTAGDFKPIHLLGILGGGLAVDPILNAISGRTKMLKTAVIVEKKEMLMAKLETLFDDKYYLETLKIPEEYIKGFQYYCVENNDFVRSLKEKNKTMCMFLIVGLATEFKQKMENKSQ